MDSDRLQQVLEAHRIWLDTRGGKRADLHGADLRDADLRHANLHDSNLRDADLRGADLRDADLSLANLRGAILRGAELNRADLRGANLSYVDFHVADLGYANLHCANLKGANLRYVNLLGVVPDWMSHDLIAEFLRREAGRNVGRRKIAGLVIASRDWCWAQFERKCRNDPLWDWALDTLAACVRDGDGAPQILRARAEKLREGGRGSEIDRSEDAGESEGGAVP